MSKKNKYPPCKQTNTFQLILFEFSYSFVCAISNTSRLSYHTFKNMKEKTKKHTHNNVFERKQKDNITSVPCLDGRCNVCVNGPPSFVSRVRTSVLCPFSPFGLALLPLPSIFHHLFLSLSLFSFNDWFFWNCYRNLSYWEKGTWKLRVLKIKQHRFNIMWTRFEGKETKRRKKIHCGCNTILYTCRVIFII